MSDFPRDIRDLVQELNIPLIRTKKGLRYECPICKEAKLSISQQTGKYNCFGGPHNSEILLWLWQEWRAKHRYSKRGTRENPQEKILLKAEQKEDALFPSEWDSAGQSLTKWFGLSSNSQNFLVMRGYDTGAIEQMKNSGWFSIPAGRREVTHLKDIPKNFPGTQWWQDEVNLKTQYLCSPRIEVKPGVWESREAIAIPRYRWNGQITGYQLRLIGSDLEKGNRYRYLYGGANGNQVKLFSLDAKEVAESALTICDSRRLFRRGELTINGLNFVEANLKPHTCAYKHGGIWVGTNSNYFASSPVQLHDLAIDARRTNIKILRFHLDARTLPCEKKPEGNPAILINWARLAQFFYKNYPGEFEIEVYAYGEVDPDEVEEISRGQHFLGVFNDVFASALKASKKLSKAAKSLLRGDRGCEWTQEIRRIQRWLHRKILQLSNDRELQRIKAKNTTAIVLRSQSQEWGETYLKAWPVENPPYLLYNPNNSDSINYTRHKHSPTALMPRIRLRSIDDYGAFHRDAFNMGCKHLLNNTEAGGGKSHNTALLDPREIGIDSEFVEVDDGRGNLEEKELPPRSVYYTETPMNATNLALEELFTHLPGRAEELFENFAKQTPSGRNYIHSSNPNGIYIPIPDSGNCGYSSLHSYLQSFGYSPEVRYGAICQQCPAMKDREPALNCSRYKSSMTIKHPQTGEEQKFPFGFLSERIDVLSNAPRLRLHHTQSPGENSINAEKGQRSGISDTTDLVVHDDCKPQTTATYYISAATCDKTARILRQNHQAALLSEIPEDIAKTTQQLEAFDKLLTTLSHYIEHAELGKYGLGDPDVRSAMAKDRTPEDPSPWAEVYNKLLKVIDSQKAESYIDPVYHSYRTICLNLYFSCRGLGSNLGELKEILTENKGKSVEECLNALRGSAVPQFLRPLMLVGLGYGSFRIEREFNMSTQQWENRLAITVKDRSQVRNSRGVFNIHLDATMTRAEYSQLYGVREKDVWVMQNQPMDHSNLTVFQYNDFGKLASGKWSQEILDRLTAAITAAHQSDTQWSIDSGLDPNGIGLIAPKWLVVKGIFDHIIPRERQGWWFAHTRGTNVWENCHTLYCVGSPRSHLGQLAVDWQVQTGESIDLNAKDQHPKFRKWANQLTRKEQVQTAARLRSGRSESPKNIHWFCSESLRFLEREFSGCKVLDKRARELSPKAAPKVDRHLLAMGEAMKSCWRNGINPTQKLLASMINWSTTRISDNCKKLMEVLTNSGEVHMTGRQYYPLVIKTSASLYEALIGKRKFAGDQEITEPMRQFAEALFPKELQSYLDQREKIAAQIDYDVVADDLLQEQLFSNAWRILGRLLRCAASDSTVIQKVVGLLDWGDREILYQVLMDIFPTNPDLEALEHAIDVSPASIDLQPQSRSGKASVQYRESPGRTLSVTSPGPT